jgi:hypothetical protein
LGCEAGQFWEQVLALLPVENWNMLSMTAALPEGELFVYEDALPKGQRGDCLGR